MSVISTNTAPSARFFTVFAIFALVTLPSLGAAAVVAHTPAHGTPVRTSADGTGAAPCAAPTAVPTADPTASKDTTGWQ